MPDGQIRLRATTHIRNDYMLSARKKLHLTQIALAQISGVPIVLISKLERLEFPKEYPYQRILSISGVLEIPPEHIMPERLTGWKGQTKFSITADVQVDRLLEYQETKTRRFLLPSPDETIENKDDIARIKQMLKKFLSEREQKIIILRYGLDGGVPLTLNKIGKILGIKRNSAKMAEAKAIHKLQEKASNPYWMNKINKKSVDIID